MPPVQLTALLPIVKVMNENFGIESGLMTTIHGYTAESKYIGRTS